MNRTGVTKAATTTTTIILLGGLSIALLSGRGMGQAGPASVGQPGGMEGVPPPFYGPMPPQTRLEAISTQKGVVLVKGYTDIGETQSDDGTVVRVTAVEFTDAGKQARERGLAVTVRERNAPGDAGPPPVSFVDYDEIEPLANALDTLVKLDMSASPMANFEGEYRTRGDLQFSNHTSNGTRVISVRAVQVVMPTGQVLSSMATFRPARLAEFRQQLAAAKETLDRAKDAADAAK